MFLRRQLAIYAERGVIPRRAKRREKLLFVALSDLFDWRDALLVVRPATLIRWQREWVRFLWRRKCERGRPPIPRDLRVLIHRIASENPSWGEQRIADELLVKLGVAVSARTVRKYIPRKASGERAARDQRWSTFLRNHAKQVVACDFAVAMTARLQIVYVFIVMEIGSRRILHVNTTEHPTAEWTTQQLREVFADDHGYQCLLHDRDAIFSAGLDASVGALGVEILKSPPRSPKANAFCERLIGTLRRECLDWIIPLGENHIHEIVREWAAHYNRGRPHTALGPNVPDQGNVARHLPKERHRLQTAVVARPVLNGLHHEYTYDRAA